MASTGWDSTEALQFIPFCGKSTIPRVLLGELEGELSLTTKKYRKQGIRHFIEDYYLPRIKLYKLEDNRKIFGIEASKEDQW